MMKGINPVTPTAEPVIGRKQALQESRGIAGRQCQRLPINQQGTLSIVGNGAIVREPKA